VTDLDPTDRELLAAHVGGDRDAFSVLLQRHQDRLWAVAVRTTGNPQDAADGLQDGVISAYRRADTYRGDAAVTTWLHRIVVNACLDLRRRLKARPAVSLADHEPADKRDPQASAETRLDVWSALDHLPEHQRQTLVLVDMHGLSVAEAAQVLEVAEGTVKSRCARGRAALLPMLRVSDEPESGPSGNPLGSADVPKVSPSHPGMARHRTGPEGGQP
jgi:RNA polymerase sigma-70 factor, ECF subfamily